VTIHRTTLYPTMGWWPWGMEVGAEKPRRSSVQLLTAQGIIYGKSVFTVNLILSCMIWGFHCGDYEECRLLGSYAVWLL
jgi:hypothetical protein